MKKEQKDQNKKLDKKEVNNTVKINPPLKEGLLSFKQFLETIVASEVTEALTVPERLKRAMNIKRREAVLQNAKKRALSRHADKKRLEKRSRRDAIGKMKSKYSGGQKASDLSYGDKARIEDILKTKKGAVTALSKKLVNAARERENQRHANKNKGEK